MSVDIYVTPEQVRMAQMEVRALRSAGLTPDPLVVRLANAEVVPRRIGPAEACDASAAGSTPRA